TVGQRTREIGLRMALGAKPSTVLGLVMSQGMLLVAIGVVIGVAGALAALRLIASVLYGNTSDVVSFVGASLPLLPVPPTPRPPAGAPRMGKAGLIRSLRYGRCRKLTSFTFPRP